MKKIILITLVLFACFNSYSQYTNFSQNFSNPLFLNPAFAGSIGCSRMTLDYRNHPDPGSMVTYSATYDQYADKIKGGIGLQFVSENFGRGNFTTNTINGMYAYNYRINDNLHLRPAINVGIGINHLEENLYPKSTSSKNYFNIGYGMLVVYKNLISGLSIDHLNNPDIGMYGTDKLPRKFTIHFNYEFPFMATMQLTTGIIYFHQKDYIKNEIVYNLMLQIKFIKAGIGFRQRFANPDGAILMLGYCCNWMSIGLSYDRTISRLSSATVVFSEISAVFKFNCKNDKEKFAITPLHNF